VDHKYNNNPNIFCCPIIGASPFWKGVLWATKAAQIGGVLKWQIGAPWKVGNGQTIRFWEDCWFGTCSLAIQY
jgi:hypothetical protein